MRTNGKNHLITPLEYEMNMITLAFASANEEQTFKETGSMCSLGFFRTSIIAASVLYIVYILLRFWNFLEIDGSVIILQDFVFAIPAISIIIASFNPNFVKFIQTAGIILFSVSAITVLSTSAMWPVSNHFFIYCIISVTIFGYTFLRLRFISASIIGWLTLIAFTVIQIALLGISIEAVAKPLIALGITNIAGMVISYLLEYFTRRSYLLEKILLSEKTMHGNLLSELEQKKQTSEDLIKFKEGLEENKVSLVLANFFSGSMPGTIDLSAVTRMRCE